MTELQQDTFAGIKAMTTEILKDNLKDARITVTEYTDEIVITATLNIKREVVEADFPTKGAV